MNERIYELWLQAAGHVSPLKERGEWQRDFVGKFAELIVKECGHFTDPVTRNLMMKHFGVEE